MEHRIPCSGGGQLTRRPHALSYDGDSVILCNTNRLCVYSTLSGEKLYDLHGHKDEVTSVCLHPKLKNQVYSCSRAEVSNCGTWMMGGVSLRGTYLTIFLLKTLWLSMGMWHM